FDVATGIALDGNGNIYVTGWSTAAWGSPLHEHSAGSADMVVLKLNSSGAYQWHTFYGGNGSTNAYKIAVDGSGNICVTGSSNVTWGSPKHAHSVGSNDDI